MMSKSHVHGDLLPRIKQGHQAADAALTGGSDAEKALLTGDRTVKLGPALTASASLPACMTVIKRAIGNGCKMQVVNISRLISVKSHGK